jgi:opacity protein-like surface antigen
MQHLLHPLKRLYTKASRPVLATALSALLAGLACVAPAQAQSARPYLGIGAGLATVDVGNDSETVPALQLVSGIQLHSNFAMELSYMSTTSVDAPGTDFSLSSIGVSGLLLLPISIGRRDSLTLFGKLGLSQTSALYDGNDNAATVDDFGLNYGLGVQYAPSRSFALRLSRDTRPYARGRQSDDAALTSISAIFSF